MIRQDCLDRILDNCSLIETAERLGIEGKRKGAQWTGRSPFTNEKTGSFQISESKFLWKCFSSGKGSGGRMAAVNLVIEKEGMDWFTAIKYLADWKNITIEFEEETPDKKEARKSVQDKIDMAYKAMQIAEKFYAANRGEKEFSEWCVDRQLPAEDIDKWQLGWAPLYSKHVATEVQRKDLFQIGLEIGLIKQSADDAAKIYDTLSSRITIPLHDIYGRVVGFAGRYVEVAKKEGYNPPKYINPSESLLYSKGKMLYGWSEARKIMGQTETAYVVEGYADVWAMHRAGLANTVAHCGKFITVDQLNLLKRVVGTLVFCLEDMEAVAGYNKCVEDALKIGFSVLVCDLRLKDKKRDADDLFKQLEESDEELQKATFVGTIASCTSDGLEFSIGQLQEQWNSPTNHGKVVDQIIYLLDCVRDANVRESYLTRAAKTIQSWTANVEYQTKLEELDAALAQESITEKQFLSAKNTAQKASQKKADKYEPWVKKLQKQMADANKNARIANGGLIENQTSNLVSWSGDELMPDWVEEKLMKKQGFVQRAEGCEFYPNGIYFPHLNGMSPRYVGACKATNYVIIPKYHIRSAQMNRRMVEINNGSEKHTLDLPDKALTSISNWEEVMINKGDFVATEIFSKYHFVKIRNYITSNIMTAYEITTLGWQPSNEFWSWSNAVAFKDAETQRMIIRDYDESGIVAVNDKKYLSASMSEFSRDMMDEGRNPFENDLYLSYKDGGHGFADWANLFMEVYNDHGEFGVAFALLSINKDLVYKMQQKMPLLYLYGPKGSGKSAFGESLQNLFFSGTNSDGRLIQAVNMTPGMISPYAFYNALSRFRNCFRLFNEYDPMVIDQSFRGMFKAAYDGEGRERGSGDGFVRTEIQKVLGTIGLAGQYLDTNDDGALMSRSINLSFSEERNKTRTEAQKEKYRTLMHWEKQGLSGAVMEMIKWREYFAVNMENRFYAAKRRLIDGAKKVGKRNPEERLLNNYSLLISAMEVANDLCKLNNDIDKFFHKCLMRMVELSTMLTENNVLTKFFRSMETLWQDKQIVESNHFTIKREEQVTVRSTGGERMIVELGEKTPVMVMQLSKMMAVYEKEMRSRGHKHVINEATVLEYLKDQPYFIGLIPHHYFGNDVRTSGYALRYEELMGMCGVSFQSGGVELTPNGSMDNDEMPF